MKDFSEVEKKIKRYCAILGVSYEQFVKLSHRKLDDFKFKCHLNKLIGNERAALIKRK